VFQSSAYLHCYGGILGETELDVSPTQFLAQRAICVRAYATRMTSIYNNSNNNNGLDNRYIFQLIAVESLHGHVQ